MHGIVALAMRHCKSSRGTPRLRPAAVALHGALRIAPLRQVASTSIPCSTTAATVEEAKRSFQLPPQAASSRS